MIRTDPVLVVSELTNEVDEEDISEFLAEIATAGVRYREISVQKPTLEDYFLKLANKSLSNDGPSVAQRPEQASRLETAKEAL